MYVFHVFSLFLTEFLPLLKYRVRNQNDKLYCNRLRDFDTADRGEISPFSMESMSVVVYVSKL